MVEIIHVAIVVVIWVNKAKRRMVKGYLNIINIKSNIYITE